MCPQIPRKKEKNSLFLYLKWWVAQEDFSQLLTNKSVRATCTTVILWRGLMKLLIL